jgi:hypothetical protein
MKHLPVTAKLSLQQQDYCRTAYLLVTYTDAIAQLTGCTGIVFCRNSVHRAILQMKEKENGFVKINFGTGKQTEFVLIDTIFISGKL